MEFGLDRPEFDSQLSFAVRCYGSWNESLYLKCWRSMAFFKKNWKLPTLQWLCMFVCKNIVEGGMFLTGRSKNWRKKSSFYILVLELSFSSLILFSSFSFLFLPFSMYLLLSFFSFLSFLNPKKEIIDFFCLYLLFNP